MRRSEHAPPVLVGDLGGTNLRLAIRAGREELALLHLACGSLSGLEEGLTHFRDAIEKYRPVSACLGVAGPVNGAGEVHLTNLGWDLSEQALSERLSIPTRLINDFQAQAEAIPLLLEEDRAHLGGPEVVPSGRPIAVLGAGTGLGEAYLIPTPSGEYLTVPGEGGHVRFAPRDDFEIELLRALTRVHGPHVSSERVLSGAGLVSLYRELLRWRLRADPSSSSELEPLSDGPAISGAALSAPPHPVALDAVTRFIEILADEAANLCLKVTAGAVFLSGGIAPQLRPLLDRSFPPAFLEKGRYRGLLQGVHISLVTHPKPALLGAQRVALRATQREGDSKTQREGN